MANLDIMKTYRLALTPEEFRLVLSGLRALGKPDALELNRFLCEQQHKQNTMAVERSGSILQSATDECEATNA